MFLFRDPTRPLGWVGKVLWCIVLSLVAALLLTVSPPTRADDAEALKTESPYFLVQGGDPGTDRLPLKSTSVDVRIAGVIADVTVTQHYRNEGQRPIEARYVFPGSTQAAVHALTVRLGGRVLTARIREKQQARIEYDGAKRQGKTAALLEQQRPNVFEMNVANILPGDDVAVELRYTELLTPSDGQYGFVFPTVAGPRYNSPQGAARGERWVSTPYLREGVPPASAFQLQVILDTPLPAKDIASPSHPIEVEGLGLTQARVTLPATPAKPHHDRDFILHYRLAGERIESGLMLYRGLEENFFLAMVEPPQAVPVQQISPREYIFVVDISGSMHGFPLETAKALLEHLIGGLRPSDSFNVMLFSGGSRMLAPQSVPATMANINQALQVLRETAGGGSTEIVPALKRIAALPKTPDVSRTVIVVTDGFVAVESEVFQLVRRQLGQSNLFAFGIGSSVNRHLIEGMARAGQGEAFVVTRPELAAAQAERLRRMIESPVLTRVTARFEGLDTYDVEPRTLPDVLGGRPVVVFGKWRGDGLLPQDARLVVEGLTPQGPWRSEVAADAAERPAAAALRHLWARRRIETLSDQEALEGGQRQKEAITALGLEYGLLTPYTSFVAIDQRVRHADAAGTPTVDQPSPLPEGVSALSIGAEVPSTPEPSAWLALAVVGVVVVATVVARHRG